MAKKKPPNHISSGKAVKTIQVGLSYKIVELFSEGLYASANKAFEELVTNSFDAGAENVFVKIPSDPTASDATIVVVDDGEGMDVAGLEDLWKIGASKKRSDPSTSKKRPQIGKFGIGKLATYVLASQLTHISKSRGKYYAVSMDFDQLDSASGSGVVGSNPVSLKVRQLTAVQAKEALTNWTSSTEFSGWNVSLFGKDAPKSWTFAILSLLKDKAHEIQPGRLDWILRTILPLGDDFSIVLNGKKLTPSKHGKGRIGRWTIGKDISELAKPAPDDLEVRIDSELATSEPHHFGMYHPDIGRVTGYAEGYKKVLTTGKSEKIARSYGFFVYVRGRLINVDDEYFGIDSNLLRHGAFSRFRLEIHIDKLDEELRSARDGVREGPLSKTAQNLMHAIFNFARKKIDDALKEETAAENISRRISESPAVLSRRPFAELARLAFAGDFSPRLTRLPEIAGEEERTEFLKTLEARIVDGDDFISEVDRSYALGVDDAIAVLDLEAGILRINALHPFVAAFSDDYFSEKLPLDLLALAEVLLEAQLHQFGFTKVDVDKVLDERDDLLRALAKSSGHRTAIMVAQDLQDARNDANQLEIELVAAFNKLGYEATRVGGRGKPDGIANAHLSAGENGVPRRYSVSLEAKSKKKEGQKVSAKTVGISAIARQRDDFKCEHAVVVGPAFPTKQKEKSALVGEIDADREKTKDNDPHQRKTITLINVDDLAELVRIAPLKQLNPANLRDLYLECSTPEDVRAWINKRMAEEVERYPFSDILDVIWEEQKQDPLEIVDCNAIRVSLRHSKEIQLSNESIREACQALGAMAPGMVVSREYSVAIEVPPEQVLEVVRASTADYPNEEQSLFKGL